METKSGSQCEDRNIIGLAWKSVKEKMALFIPDSMKSFFSVFYDIFFNIFFIRVLTQMTNWSIKGYG
ncbi:MAG: hypothetical protein CVV64_08300 [Candidatus Wallbacteria bacterium HGW-Wallbacteria-1]|uniref:Uncharacterized protein n=1 Tax=Candidatus Wallbacteria bacterium HGW-Wallbacteria-1 TaxID=2013854 RepID=A0A2N1PRA8_9BACT|nr:MAG: hypothetical protein CVV64_08300 [Candidatus Wallbacteria bacterium HGW-Wallbacteria-1]